MTSVFNWRAQASEIDWKQQNHNHKVSIGTSAWICSVREKGIEPSISGTTTNDPKNYVARRKK